MSNSDCLDTLILRLNAERDLLNDDLQGMDQATLDWEPVPGAETITTKLLHIAAVEFLATWSVIFYQGGNPSLSLWNDLSPGFARVTGTPQASGIPLNTLSGLLAQVRAETLQTFGSGHQLSSEANMPMPNPSLLQGLNLDPNGTLVAGFVRKMLPTPYFLASVTKHDSYHRGGITLQKFLHSAQQNP